RVGVVVAAMIGVLAGCAFGAGYVKQIPAALNEIEGVTSVEVGKGYDGLNRRTVVTVALDPAAVDAGLLQNVLVALADGVDFHGAGQVSLVFTDAASGEQVDLIEAVDALIEGQGKASDADVAAALESLKELAGLSFTGDEKFDQLADYVRQ
ncbi:MAG: hypothetical protein SPH79_07725, partial [Schaalia hyovaginalis]|uniref:hypothetical protein n=1 Tax=Schaalia hyovaginalis TaxID=29316 RepID=UPI002A9113E9